jgi:outer membrane protein TolC
VAKQNLLPQLDLSLFVSRVGRAASYSDAWRVGEVRSGVNLTSSYPIEQSAERANRAVAELTLIARERSVKQQEESIEGEVRSAVRELERIRKSVDLQRKGVLAAAQQRRLAVFRYQRGLASNFDVVDAEGSFLLARSALVSLLASHEVAQAELRRVTGVDESALGVTP